MPDEQIKLCKDCKWFSAITGDARCINQSIVPIDLVYGSMIKAKCSEMRKGDSSCGLEGKFWESKRPQQTEAMKINESVYCTASDLFGMVKGSYPQPSWTVLSEVRDGTGFSTRGQSCDAMAFGTWPSRGLRIVGFEFKSYRADWLRELKNHEKAEKFSGYCDEWWLVTGSNGVAKIEEIPHTWGWAIGTSKGLKRVKEPEPRVPGPIDRLFFMSIIRNISTAYVPAGHVKKLAEQRIQKAIDEEKDRNKFAFESLRAEAEALQKRIKEFQEASGIEIDRWTDGAEIGRIVKAVKNGSIRWQIRSIVEAATKAKEVLDAVAALESAKLE